MDRRRFARETADRCRDEIIQVVQDMIRIPSQNKPPVGEELAVQEYQAEYLKRAGLPVDLYQPDQVPGMREHPDFWPGRDYTDRPNLCSTLKGRGGGRSLLLTGHADTVALGDNVWSKPPFGAEIHDGRLYGLGSSDMKGQMGAMLVMYKAIAELGLPLRGTLTYECVVDEEEGGVNATIAGRLRGGPMDGAIVPEATGLDIYPAIRGALIINFTFSAEGTWLDVGKSEKQADAVEQIGIFLTHLDELRESRRNHPVPDIYKEYADPVPVQVTKVYAGGWGSEVPIAVPPVGRIQVIMQTVPGEERASVLKELEDWLDSVVARNQAAFPARPQMEFGIRWMYPTQTDRRHPLVTTLQNAIEQVTGESSTVKGAPYSCDLWALHRIFDMPGVVFGPAGANAHAADEYVVVESLFTFVEALLMFVMEWCEVDDESIR
jgi:acetylornithine deacetylase